MTGRKIGQDTIEKIVAMYPTMFCAEIAEVLGISPRMVHSHAKRLGLKHSEETIARIKAKRYGRFREWCASARAKEAWARSGRKIAKLWRMERLRALSGMKQESRYKVSVLPAKIRRVIYNLAKRYGYLYADDSTMLWYDGQTSRNPREQYYANRYGIRFVPAEGQEGEE